MILNIFYFVGVSVKNVILGVLCLCEIINVVKKIKILLLIVYLKFGVNKEKEKVKNVQCVFEYIIFCFVIQVIEIWYDLELMSILIEEDVEFVRLYYEMLDEDVVFEKILFWLLCIEFNCEMMVDKKLSMVDIVEKINFEFDDDLICIFNDDNVEKFIFCI